MPSYRILDDVDAYEGLISNLAAEVAARDLQIDLPAIDFVTETIPCLGALTYRERFLGLAVHPGRQIYLRSGLDHKTLAEVVFHEMRHSWQFQRRSTLSLSHREHDADIYAWGLMIQIGQPSCRRVLESLLNTRRRA